MLFDYYELVNAETNNVIRYNRSTLDLRTNVPDDPSVHWTLDPEPTAPVIEFIWLANPLQGMARSGTNAILNVPLALQVAYVGEESYRIYYVDGTANMVLTEDDLGNVQFANETDKGDKRQKWKFKRYIGTPKPMTSDPDNGNSRLWCFFCCCCCCRRRWWRRKK